MDQQLRWRRGEFPEPREIRLGALEIARSRPASTINGAWRRLAAISARRSRSSCPSIPFVGLAESMVLTAFRKAGVSLHHIRQAIPVQERAVGIAHALDSQRLYTDGAVILYDYAATGHSTTRAADEGRWRAVGRPLCGG
ncbi:MAG: hypothetical protein ACRDYA_15270, partial [Egibacteraceae bacterium]